LAYGSFIISLDTRHENDDTHRLRNVCCVTKSNNPTGDWLQSSSTDTLLVSSRHRERLYR